MQQGAGDERGADRRRGKYGADFYEPVHPYTKKLSDMARKLYQVAGEKKDRRSYFKDTGTGKKLCKKFPVWKIQISGSGGTAVF